MTILLILIAVLIIVVLFLGISFWLALPGEPRSEKDEKNNYTTHPGVLHKDEKTTE